MVRSTRGRVLLGTAVVVVLAAGFGIWWFLIRDDAPPRASVEAAAEGQDESGGGGEVTPDDVEGDWTVERAPDSAEAGTGTFAGYRIGEELASIGTQTAVGRTRDVTGTVTIADGQVTDVDVEVDMTTLQSDETMRDNRLRTEGLQTDEFPAASFTLTEPLDLPDSATQGEELSFQAVGDLTLHGVTRPVTVDLQASLDGETIAAAGSAPVALADFDIEKPTGFSVLSIEDEGTFEFQLLLTRQ